MKLLLRSHGYFVQSYKYQRLIVVPVSEEERRKELERERQEYEGEEPYEEAPKKKKVKLAARKSLFDERAEERSFEDLGHQLSWETAAPHLMVQGYRYLEPINRTILAKEKLRKYEASLQQPIEKIIDNRLISEKYVKKRQAELFLHRMAPLTSIFLDQGVNFLSAHVFAKLIEDERPSILKDFLNKGSFQAANFIDGEFLREYLPHFIDNPKQYFLLNVLSFEKNLLKGTVGQQQKEDYHIVDDGQAEDELKCLADINIGWRYLIRKSINIIDSNETEFNRLRIYWAIQKLYDSDESYMRNILSELSYVTLKVEPQLQGEVNKEMRHIFTSAYSKKPFLALIGDILNRQKTFHEFITAYTLAIIALSKLKAITKLLPQSKSNQLHPIFQLIEFNLPKESHQTLILAILKLLSHQDHSRIEFQNFKRSYNYWLKDYTQPETTKYHSTISKLLEVNEDSLTIRYERNPKCPQYATFSHKLSRNKKPKKENTFIGQKQSIKHLLKKDYQPVLNQFITTFSLSANRELSQKFHKEMDNIDKTLQFNNKNEEALYKLKVAHEMFFHTSLPNPLSMDKLKPFKKGFDSIITITDYPIGSFDYTQQFQAYNSFEMLSFLLQEGKEGKNLSDEADMVRAEEEMVGEEVEAKADEEVQGEQAVQAVEQPEEELAAETEPLQEQEIQDLQAAKSVNTKSQAYRQAIQALVTNILFQGQQRYIEILQNYEQLVEDDEPQVKAINYRQDIPNEDLYQLFFMDEVEPETDERYDGEGLFEYIEENCERESEDGEKEEKVEVPEKTVFFKKKKKSNVEEKELRADDLLQKEHQERKLPKSEYQAKKMFGNKKNKFQFSTVQNIPTTEDVTPVFNIDLMNQYRKKEVDQHFLTALQNEQHVSTVSSGSAVAKYLFLHGKNENANFVSLPNKTLNIEFTSVIGTRAKNYERYVQKNLFRYALPSQFYEELLVQQQRKYNRFEFKQIVSHLIHYNESISDYAIDAICKICEKQRIGYTFVQIAHLIKANNIKVSSQSLESITNVWQKFDVINEDMLPFLKDYCRKMQIPFKTEYYAQFCKGLIKTKGFGKLEVIANTILTEIKPKPFKIDSSMTNMKADQVALLEKEWKTKEQENYLRLYLQLIEVIVKNLDNFVPEYLAEYFQDYRKMKPELNERELGYAFVCFAHKREKIQELLEKLDKQPEKGTSFMYDCLLQTILSNFQPLQDLSEKMLDVTVLKNRVVLSNPQILRSITVFKKSSSSNSFSKFLDHCLRFQHTIHESHEIKKDMFYVLNNNVEDVSVGGIFNLLDFIFNEKREKERIEYRAVKLSEEEKSKKLQEIQQSVTKNAVVAPKKEEKAAVAKKDGKKKGKKVEEQAEKPEPVTAAEAESADKQEKKEDDAEKKGSKKQDKKKDKKEKASERERQNNLLDQILAEQQAKSLPQSSKGNSDEEFIQMIKGQTKKHESTKRKSLQSMSTLFQGSLQLIRQQEATRAKQAEKKTETKKETQQKKDKKKGRK